MKISKNGIQLIKSFEGCRLKAYKPVSTERYYTIGYGHYGVDVTKNMQITEDQAEQLLVKDLSKFENHVNFYLKYYEFTQNQFDALVSFAFNIGSINQLTASGTRTLKQISNMMPAYTKAGGRVLQGLVRRREAEKKLFDTADAVSKPTNTIKIPTFNVGDTYILNSNLAVRVDASASSKLVGYDKLTASAKKADKDKNGYLEKGTKVTCKAVKTDKDNNIWIKIPSGYIAAFYNGKEMVSHA